MIDKIPVGVNKLNGGTKFNGANRNGTVYKWLAGILGGILAVILVSYLSVLVGQASQAMVKADTALISSISNERKIAVIENRLDGIEGNLDRIEKTLSTNLDSIKTDIKELLKKGG